jgi:hypothetical protein
MRQFRPAGGSDEELAGGGEGVGRIDGPRTRVLDFDPN